MQPGVQRFTDDMTRLGIVPRIETGLVVYRVEPVDGAHAGNPVETGISVDELLSWPLAPPHWIHFPASIRFPRTNSQPSPRPGWVMHSRQITGWGDTSPGIGWVSHIRAVLSEVTS